MSSRMWDFEEESASIAAQTYNKICNLLRITISAQMDKIQELYMSNKELATRVSAKTYFIYEMESLLYFFHITDVMLLRWMPGHREEVMASLYDAINQYWDIQTFFPGTPFELNKIIEDRMEQYTLIDNRDWRPCASWYLGKKLSDDAVTQSLAQTGDYILYALIAGKIPLKEDIESVLLTSIFDCELLALPTIILRFLSHSVAFYIETIDKELSSFYDQLEESHPSKTVSSKQSVFKKYIPMAIVSILAVLLIVVCLCKNNGEPILEDTPLTKQTVETQTDAPQYFGSKNSDIVHKRTCNHARNILFKNRVYYDTLSEALADGRKRCSSCLSTEQTGTSVSPSSSPSSPGLSVRERLEAALADEKRYNQADHIRNVAGVREARKGNE